MKKLLSVIALGVAVLSTNVMAEDDDRVSEWYEAVNGRFLVKDMMGSDLYAQLYTTTQGEVRVGFPQYEPECDGFESNFYSGAPLRINNTIVKMSYQCMEEDVSIFYATTTACGQYIVNEFKRSKSVAVEGVIHDMDLMIFSAMNFTKLYNKQRRHNVGI